MDPLVLVINAGSSTHKLVLFNGDKQLWKGSLDWGGLNPILKAETASAHLEKKINGPEIKSSLESLLDTLIQGETQVIEKLDDIVCVGHRVVQGGEKFRNPVLIDDSVKMEIEKLSVIAPLHNPANLQGIDFMQHLLPKAKQVAVFDTSFYQHLEKFVYVYPGPLEWWKEGIRKYGFHGISHQYCCTQAAKIWGKPLNEIKVVSCHLGNGCSITAIDNGKAINTSMGFTPLEGIMMGTRSGSIDPGILLYLANQKKIPPLEIDQILNHRSGLKGICGHSDMREILQLMQSGNEEARLAYEMFAHHLKEGIGQMIASLGRVDLLVFTAGIGENVPILREKVCQDLEFLNIKIDPSKNSASKEDRMISLPSSLCQVSVIHTREEWQIAQFCQKML